MDLPATQALDEDELPATQQFATNENNENALVGTLHIEGKSYSIISGVTTIGRHPACKIILNHETISKKHAEIEAESSDGAIFIRDLNSSNKTKINNSKLRPTSLYQMKDGDKLTFGKLTGIFKLYQAVDDSIISCTPQVNRKIQAIIPGTPDSSMNASSASESDVSIIPGTQTDKNDTSFRRPQIPVRTSNELRSPRVPAFSLDDLPSPLSKDKNKQDEFSESETQRFSTNDTKEDSDNDNSIYTAATQKPFGVGKCDDSDGNIYDMETQRPINPDEDKDGIENLETQRCDLRKSDSDEEKSNDVSIHSTTKQKNVSKAPINESIENLKTQQFNARNSNSTQRKSLDVSIYSAETQKNEHDTIVSIESLETQQFEIRKSDISKRKSNDVSIYSAETQKNVPVVIESIENLETQQFDTRNSNSGQQKSLDVSIYSAETQKNVCDTNESVENLETQQFEIGKSPLAKSKSNDVSIYSAETQKNVPDANESIENLETQQFEVRKSPLAKSKSNDVSIYSAETQKNVPDASDNKSIENFETQQFNVGTSDSDKRKSNDASIYNAETQKSVPNVTDNDKSIENMETQQSDIHRSDKFRTPNSVRRKSNKSIYDAEIQKCVAETPLDESIENMETEQVYNVKSNKSQTPPLDKSKSNNMSIYEAETQKCISEEPVNESMENLETQRFECEKSVNRQTPVSIEEQSINKSLKVVTQNCLLETVVDKSIDDLETQQFANKTSNTIINESTENIESQQLDQNSKKSLSLSLNDMETMPLIDHKGPLSKDVQGFSTEELSFDSGCRTTEQNCDQDKIISLTSEDHNSSNLQIKKPVPSSSQNFNKSSTENSLNNISSLQKEEHITSKSVSNIEQEKSLIEEEDDDEMFCSQNLIQNCPFAFLPEESTVNNEQSTIVSRKSERIDENKERTDDSIFNASTDINNKIAIDQPVAKSNDDDSETDEEGIFSSHTSKEDKETDNKNNMGGSETDEEGVFSSHLSKEEESDKFGAENNSVSKNIDDKMNEADSETDEEGIFSDLLSSKDESSKTNTINNSNSKKSDSKNNEKGSETDEEGIFSSHLSNEDKKDDNSESDEDKKDDNSESDEDIFDNPSKTTDTSKSSTAEPLPPKQNRTICQKLPTSDSLDNMFDDDCEERSSIKKSEITNDVPTPTRDSFTKVDSFPSKQIENTNKASIITDANEEVDELAPTQIVNTNVFETEDMNLAPTQVINSNESLKLRNSRIDAVDDLAPTQIIDTQRLSTVGKDLEDEFLAPTQIVYVRKSLAPNSDDDSLAPTQIIPKDRNPVEKAGEDFDDIDLAPTQKIADTQRCSVSQLPTQIIDREPNDVTSEVNRNASIEDLEYETAPTQMMDEVKRSVSLNSSKRQLEEIEITCNKKLKKTGDTQSVKIDLYTSVEKNLDEMFEGAEDEPVEANQSVLLTQQLANILECSQNEDSLVTDLNTSKPSPTLSTGRKTYKAKTRRRAMLLGRSDSPGRASKAVINLNDTIERNLNEMFDDSVNSVEAYESDEMMTQQLKNVLQSQDDAQRRNEEEEPSVTEKSPSLSTSSEKKRHRLSLSSNMSTSSTSKKPDGKQKSKSSSANKEATSLESKSNTESQETEEYFANLKSSKKKMNVLEESQEDVSSNPGIACGEKEKEVVYKRGIVGFSEDGKAVSSQEREALLEPKGMRSFTSDSQSDGEDPAGGQSIGKRRFKLSLSKHVDLNSSLSSTSDQEAGKKPPNELQPSSSSKVTGKEHRAERPPKARRPLARGTRGFSSGAERLPVESQELVSATSTESDEELRTSPSAASKKVCTSKVYRSVSVDAGQSAPAAGARATSSKPRTPSPRSERASDAADSDEEFLRNMPEIRVAGTADCPATSSQLAAPSDREDEESEPEESRPLDIVIPRKWNWYAERRYDLVYKRDEAAAAEARERSAPREPESSTTPSVEEVLAQIEKASGKPRSARDRAKLAASDPADGESKASRSTRNRAAPATKSSAAELLTRNADLSFADGDSDSDVCVIPKYEPLPPMRFAVNQSHAIKVKGKEEEDEDSDQEFEQLRKTCAKMLAVPSVYASKPPGALPKLERATAKRSGEHERASPLRATRRRRKSALSGNCNSLNISRSGPESIADDSRSNAAGTLDQDAFVFQVSDDKSSKVPTTSRMSGLTIIRNKRSVGTDVADDAQNQPPKRTKMAPMDERARLKLQELSPDAAPPTRTFSKVTKTLDSFVLLRRQASRTASSDPSAVDASVLVGEEKQTKSNESRSKTRATRVKAAPSGKNTKKVEAPSLVQHGNNSGKENLVVEDSDLESVVPQTSRARSARPRRNQAAVKDSSRDGASSSSTVGTAGRATRQKKDVPVRGTIKAKKEASVIQDSDAEQSDESEFVNKGLKIRPAIIVKDSDSEKSEVETSVDKISQNKQVKDVKKSDSNKSENFDLNVNKETRSTRAKRVKESDSEKSDNSGNTVNKATQRRRVKDVKGSDSEMIDNSQNTVNKANRSRHVKNGKDSDSEMLDNSQNTVNIATRSRRVRDVKDSDSVMIDNSQNAVNKATRSKRVKDVKDSDSEMIDNSQNTVNNSTRSRRVKDIKDSDSEIIDNSQNAINKATRSRRVKEIKDSDSEIIDNSQNTVNNPNRSRRVKDIKDSDSELIDNSQNAVDNSNIIEQAKDVAKSKSEKLDITGKKGTKSSQTKNSDSDKSDPTVNKGTRNRGTVDSESEKSDAIINKVNKSKQIMDSDSEKSETVVNKAKRSKRIIDSDSEKVETVVDKTTRSRKMKASVTEKLEVPVNKGTRSRQAKTRDQSADSVFSESSDNDKEKNVSIMKKSTNSRPARKRAAPVDKNAIEASSSEESQEIAEIFKNNIVEEVESRSRRGQRVKDTVSSSVDTQGSENNKTNVDNVFEKPVSRPKRARLNKSVKNKSSTQDNLADDEESKVNSPQRSSSFLSRTPSPDLSSSQSLLTPSRSRRVSMPMSPMKGSSYKVLFTGEKSEVHRQIVAKLGGSEMEDPAKCSILVTDKVRRTFKFLSSLARGIPIVSIKWLNDSGKAHRFLDWENYVLQDPTAETKFKFKLKESLDKAKNHKLLEGYTVLMTPHITQPPISELKDMVISSGGKPLLKAPTKWHEKTVVVTKEEDLQSAKKFIAKAPKSVTIYSTELILTGILRQELNLQEFKLSI